MIWQRDVRLSGLVFLNSNEYDIGLRRPTCVNQEQQWPSLLNDERYGYSSVLFHHPEKSQEPTIVVVGGREGRSTVSSVHIWEDETQSWRDGPSMKKPRTYLTALVVGDHVYVIGGKNPHCKPLQTIDRIAIQDLLQPKTSTDDNDDKTAWKAFSCRLATPRVHASAVSVQDRYIVVAGGITYQDPIGSVEIIDTHSPYSSVAFPGPHLNHARHSFGMEVVQNRVYVVGGMCQGPTVQGHSVEYLDFDPACLDTAKSKETLSSSMT